MSDVKTLIASVFVFLLSVVGANAACGPFPQSNFIGSFSHDQVASYVDRAHGGDWTPYIAMLEHNLKALRDLSRSSQNTVLRVRGEPVEMTPRQLNRFVYVSSQFKDVVACLAQQSSVNDLNEFETAAGGAVSAIGTDPRIRTVGLASHAGSYSGSAVRVKIVSECRDGDTVFRVVNDGSPWPDTGMFTLFRIDGPNRQMIGARRLTLGVRDSREFTVSKSQNRTGHVGISIDPSWYQRQFEIDADARCN